MDGQIVELSAGLPGENRLGAFRVLVMVMEGHLFADQCDRSLKHSAVQAYGKVFDHLAPCRFAEEVE
jgi:hypothetical protein